MACLVEPPGAFLLRLHLRSSSEQLRCESRRLLVRTCRLPMLLRKRLPQALKLFGVAGEAALGGFVLSLNEGLSIDKGRGKRPPAVLVFLYHVLGDLPDVLI